MPGDRLTHEDRERIARWLGDGRNYAEIARRLDRPTSTVSREVARNGGPGAYRADRAHQATARRARRRAPYAEPPRRTVGEFEQRFAAMMTETGLPPMPARVLACLFTSEAEGMTAAELVSGLAVSPASVSKAVSYLENLEMLRREREPGQRRERYVVDEDIWYRAWLASTRSIGRWAAAAHEGAALLGHGTRAGTRLHRTGAFFDLLRQDMATAAEHRRRTFLGG